MANILIRRGRNTYDEYKVLYGAPWDESNELYAPTKIKFHHRDKWAGKDYWKYEGTVQLHRKSRALLIMSRFEMRKCTDNWKYHLAQKIAISYLLPQTEKNQ
jgi:hypothetical protein